jgi:geranylgeranyl pyrophosphate synthase
MSKLLIETVGLVRDECQRQISVSGLPHSILAPISDTETGDLFKGHPLTLTALPLLVYEAAGAGRAGDVAAAGAAMEFLLAAGDVLDDLQDGAPQLSDLTGAGAVLYSVRQSERIVALLLLCEQALLSLNATSLPQERVARAAKLLSDLKLRAFAGQIEDVEETADGDGDPTKSLEIVQKKSGSLGRAAGAIGALLATDDTAMVRLAAEFGERLGIICQLNNDIADLWPGAGKLEDLAAGKATLPVAYANSINATRLPELAAAPGNGGSRQGLAAARDRIFESGGIHFTLVHVGVQLVKARGIARQFQAMNPASRLGELLEIT